MTDHVKKMFELASKAKENAYCPYSKFRVGACILADDGQFYSGCNIENASYSMVLCGESSAISAMITAGAKKIKEILVVGDVEEPLVPCGACRQRIREFSLPDTKVHLCNRNGKYETVLFDTLLVRSFGPEYLTDR